VTGTETPGALTEPEPAPIRPPHGPDAARYSGKNDPHTPGSPWQAARHIETVRYPPTGTPGEYAPYQARFLHRPEKVTRSGALPVCHTVPSRASTACHPEAKHGEPYRNTEPTKSDEAGPQHIATFREPARPEYAAYYP